MKPDFVKENIDSLRSEREKRGLSRLNLGLHCGVSHRMLEAWENGMCFPNKKNYNLLAEYLGWQEWV